MTGWILAASLAVVLGPTATDVLERMQKAQQELTSLAARLVQQKSFPDLGIEDPEERGRFLLLRNDDGRLRIRIEIEEPEPRIVTLNGDRYVIYQPRIKQAIEGTVGAVSDGGAFGFASLLVGTAEPGEIAQEYDLEELPKARLDGVAIEAHHVRLRARRGTSSHCREIELFVDVDTNLPVRQMCREVNGSVLTISLVDTELNPDLREEEFELDLPKDVERIRG